jgi:hypothetical protein
VTLDGWLLGGWHERVAMLGVWLLCVCGRLMLCGWLLGLGGFTLVLGGELLWGVR